MCNGVLVYWCIGVLLYVMSDVYANIFVFHVWRIGCFLVSIFVGTARSDVTHVPDTEIKCLQETDKACETQERKSSLQLQIQEEAKKEDEQEPVEGIVRETKQFITSISSFPISTVLPSNSTNDYQVVNFVCLGCSIVVDIEFRSMTSTIKKENEGSDDLPSSPQHGVVAQNQKMLFVIDLQKLQTYSIRSTTAAAAATARTIVHNTDGAIYCLTSKVANSPLSHLCCFLPTSKVCAQ